MTTVGRASNSGNASNNESFYNQCKLIFIIFCRPAIVGGHYLLLSRRPDRDGIKVLKTKRNTKHRHQNACELEPEWEKEMMESKRKAHRWYVNCRRAYGRDLLKLNSMYQGRRHIVFYAQPEKCVFVTNSMEHAARFLCGWKRSSHNIRTDSEHWRLNISITATAQMSSGQKKRGVKYKQKNATMQRPSMAKGSGAMKTRSTNKRMKKRNEKEEKCDEQKHFLSPLSVFCCFFFCFVSSSSSAINVSYSYEIIMQMKRFSPFFHCIFCRSRSPFSDWSACIAEATLPRSSPYRQLGDVPLKSAASVLAKSVLVSFQFYS